MEELLVTRNMYTYNSPSLSKIVTVASCRSSSIFPLLTDTILTVSDSSAASYRSSKIGVKNSSVPVDPGSTVTDEGGGKISFWTVEMRKDTLVH